MKPDTVGEGGQTFISLALESSQGGTRLSQVQTERFQPPGKAEFSPYLLPCF